MSPLIDIEVEPEVSFKEMTATVIPVVGYKGSFFFDASQPGGAFCKLMNVGLLGCLGWTAKTALAEGSAIPYQVFLVH